MIADFFNIKSFWWILALGVLAACHNGKESQSKVGGENIMKISSSAFQNNGKIPAVYTCDEADYSPPLQWSGVPAGTKSLALLADDPDAPMGTWVHWVIYNIPVTNQGLAENFSREPKLPDGTLQGVNDFGKIGYGGPCPPGGTHRYFFKLYALDALLPDSPGLNKKALLNTMEGHILEQAVLMGTYRRK